MKKALKSLRSNEHDLSKMNRHIHAADARVDKMKSLEKRIQQDGPLNILGTGWKGLQIGYHEMMRMRNQYHVAEANTRLKIEQGKHWSSGYVPKGVMKGGLMAPRLATYGLMGVVAAPFVVLTALWYTFGFAKKAKAKGDSIFKLFGIS